MRLPLTGAFFFLSNWLPIGLQLHSNWSAIALQLVSNCVYVYVLCYMIMYMYYDICICNMKYIIVIYNNWF